jgi:hypothetical protein
MEAPYTFQRFLGRNWWFILLSLVKLCNTADKTKKEGINTILFIILFGGFILFVMYIYWSIRYGRNINKEVIQKSHLQKIQAEEKHELWDQFKGMNNCDETLFKKAEALVPMLGFIVSQNTKSLFEALKKENDINRKLDEANYGKVFIETALFYMHLVDRIAFQYLGIEMRNTFIDAFFIEFVEALSRQGYESGIKAAQFRSCFLDAYNERQEEYGKYQKMVPQENEGTKGTLFWEFEKKIASILGSQTDILTIMLVQNNIVSSINLLKFGELFKSS